MTTNTSGFYTHWQDPLPLPTIDLLIGVLVDSGKNKTEATQIVEDFWNRAFSNGELAEAFNNAGESA